MGRFGRRLRELRKAAGMTQEQLAQSIAVTGAYISALENGKKPAPPQALVAALADQLKVDEGLLWEIAFSEREERLRRRITGVPTSLRSRVVRESAELQPDTDRDLDEIRAIMGEIEEFAVDSHERQRMAKALRRLLEWLVDGGA